MGSNPTEGTIKDAISNLFIIGLKICSQNKNELVRIQQKIASCLCFVSIMVLQATLNRRDLGSNPRRSTKADGAGSSRVANDRTPTSMGS